MRLRAAGSAGGHNGLKSIEATLGTPAYARLRIGIAPLDATRQVGDLADFVLDDFAPDEREVVIGLLPRIADAVDCWAREGIQKAMNVHNRKADP
jgi:PTH1 family peptidyl-tRNA hydrolase